MSRAFTPPETLSKEDIRTIADVRRDIWTNAFAGLGVGTVAGYILHTSARLVHQRGIWKLPFLNRNTAFLAVLLGGAVGSFVMATTTGKNEVHQLHSIFQVGATPPRDKISLSDDELVLLQSKEHPESLNKLDRTKRERNRLFRRATLNKSMEQVGGLSDSHGGRWVDNRDSNRKP